MVAKLTDEMRQALQQSGGQPVEIEDDQTRKVYVIVPRDQFQDLQHRVIHDGNLSDEEMLAVAAQAIDDPEGWGAAGMDEYDRDDTEPQS